MAYSTGGIHAGECGPIGDIQFMQADAASRLGFIRSLCCSEEWPHNQALKPLAALTRNAPRAAHSL